MTALLKSMEPDAEWQVNSPHRSSGITVRNIFQRDVPGRSMEFNITAFDGSEFYSPPHRHNFDQIRIGLEGVMGYGRQKLGPRMIGYYPEGTWYGPMQCGGPVTSAIMQFDGASQGGYVTLNRMDRATEQLRQEGRFERGFFYPASGGPRVDGYQASWERATGRPMVYSDPPRYPDAIYMNIDAFGWREMDAGVEHKTLGRFGEGDVMIEVLRIRAGASADIVKPTRRFVGLVLSGSVIANGKQLPPWSGVLSEDGDDVALTGGVEVAEILLFTLPMLGEGCPAPVA